MPKPKRYWNYRVISFRNEHEEWFQICETHYEDGKPCAVALDTTLGWGEGDEIYRDSIPDKIQDAIFKDVIPVTEFGLNPDGTNKEDDNGKR